MKIILVFLLFFSSIIMAMEPAPRAATAVDSTEKKNKRLTLNLVEKFIGAADNLLRLMCDQTPTHLAAHNVPRRLRSWRNTSFPAISIKDLLGNDEAGEQSHEVKEQLNVAQSASTASTINCYQVLPGTILALFVASAFVYQLLHQH